jgi:hypothetical protein
VDSWNKVGLLASALLPRTIHRHGLATAGAMLTCLAVILNIGPFAGTAEKAAKTPSVDAASRVAAEHDRATGPGARWHADFRPHHTPAEPEFAERMAALIGPSPFTVGMAETALVASPAVALKSAGEPEGTPQALAEPGMQEPAIQVSADQGGEQARDAIIGVWAPGSCAARDFREGLLPTIINTEGAWAGETFCLFSKRKQIEAGWTVVAKCTNARERWTSHVRLTVSENRLTWTSQRGTQAYSRCAPDVLMAQASSRP